MTSIASARPIIVDPSHALKAKAIIQSVAEYLCDDRKIAHASALAEQRSAFPALRRWIPETVTQGNTGLAIVCAYLSTCLIDRDWEQIGYHHLSLAVQSIREHRRVFPGLFTGLAGIGFATWLLNKQDSHYKTLLRSLDAMLIPETLSLAESVLHSENGLATQVIDVLDGLTGIGAYLLCRREEGQIEDVIRVVLHSILSLVDSSRQTPRWYVPARYMDENPFKEAYPQGYFNCGLAHGLPGILAFMAIAILNGITLPGLTNGLYQGIEWLLNHSADDDWGINWPVGVTLNSEAIPSGDMEICRAAWCYGNPGIARALWLTGKALRNESYCEIALEAMRTVFARPVEIRRIYSSAFCHGTAGLLHITLSFAQTTGLPEFKQYADVLIKEVLDAYNPTGIIGYGTSEIGGNQFDHPGLLDGAGGTLLTLLSASFESAPIWNRLFLIE